MTSAVSMTSLRCRYANLCSGCDLIHLDRTQLEASRRADLERLELTSAQPVDFVWIEAGQLRDRLEFTLVPPQSDGRLAFGLFSRTDREILDLETCAQLTPALQSWLTEFRADPPPVTAKRTVRLRVSPGRLRGVWLDFANEDIRDLLDDGAWLERQLARGIIVEMGQKRKRVVPNPDGPRKHRLEDPRLEPWFETVCADSDGSLKPAPLFSTIGTFTQTGFRANRALVETVLSHVRPSPGLRVAEFGAGIGNFTLPLLASGARVDVFESDRLALEALEAGVTHSRLDRTRLQIHAGDFILSSKAADRAFTENVHYDAVLVDPPRPGLGRFVESMVARARGANWIYVSCYPESFAADVKALRAHGWQLDRLTVVEQFPFTKHFEIVASLKPV